MPTRIEAACLISSPPTDALVVKALWRLGCADTRAVDSPWLTSGFPDSSVLSDDPTTLICAVAMPNSCKRLEARGDGYLLEQFGAEQTSVFNSFEQMNINTAHLSLQIPSTAFGAQAVDEQMGTRRLRCLRGVNHRHQCGYVCQHCPSLQSTKS